MDYSPFQDHNGKETSFRFAPLDLPLSYTGEPDGPQSVQSRVGPSFAEAFGEEGPSLPFAGNPFADYVRQGGSHQASPQSGFNFTSQPATPSESGPFSSDLQSMSLNPPRRQRGHRRAQSDAGVSLQPSGTRRPEQEHFEELSFLEGEGLPGDMDYRQGGANGGRTVEALESLDVEELQNILKSKSAENLSQDPKKARRILANRQSAARSKEKKIRYIADLEVRLQQLQSETTSLNTLMVILENDTASLNSENRELKQSLQSLENQAQLRDGLNERLRREVMQLKQKTQQLQLGPLGPHASQGVGGFMQDAFSDQQALLDDLLSPNGGLESPT